MSNPLPGFPSARTCSARCCFCSPSLPMRARLPSGVVAYFSSVVTAVFPVTLAVIYPYDGAPFLGTVIAAAVAIVVVSVMVACIARQHPYALVGWCWYLGTLVPVIGFV